MGKNQKEVMRHFLYWHTFVTGVEKTTKSKRKIKNSYCNFQEGKEKEEY